MNILHITAHLGAGAGKAISGTAILSNQMFSEDEHRILLLQIPEKKQFLEKCHYKNINIYILTENDTNVNTLIGWSDVIIISWWNHPVMSGFLANFPEIPCRIILWSHVNGCTYPLLPYKLANDVDNLLFTSAYSLENPYWTDTQRRVLLQKSRLVFGIGEFYPEKAPFKRDYSRKDTFTIGYMGTLGYAKLHPDFLLYCQEVLKRIPHAHFTMVGDIESELHRDIADLGLEEKFSFLGFVQDVQEKLLSFDVFGYPLNPDAYATTENAVLEAMACGLPVIMLNQGLGKYLIENGKTGLLANNPEHYGELISQMYTNPMLCQLLGKSARKDVVDRYRLNHNVIEMRKACQSILSMPRTLRNFSEIFGQTPWEWFMLCTEPKEKDIFQRYLNEKTEALKEHIKNCTPVYRAKTKSSVIHFSDTYPKDLKLAEIKQVIREDEKRINIAEENFLKNFYNTFAHLGSKRVMLYGTGYYTMLLLEQNVNLNIIALLDRNPDMLGKEFFGCCVVPAENAIDNAEAIIIVTQNVGYWPIIYKRISFLTEKHSIPVYYTDGTTATSRSEYEWTNNDYWDLTFDKVRDEIDKYDIIGFDIFDTLIMRRLYDTADIFLLMELKLEDVAADFSRIRKQLQQNLVLDIGSSNVSLDKIYSRIEDYYGLTHEEALRIQQMEIALEEKLAIARRDVVELFYYAKNQGKRVDVISDMYLPQAVIEHMLNNLGIIGYDHIWISGDTGMEKSDGTFWKYYRTATAGQRVLFLGDNETSDVNNAQKCGISAIWLYSASKMLESSSMQSITPHIQGLSESITMGLVAAHLFNSPFALSKSRGTVTFNTHESLGYSAFAPVVFNYTIWILQESIRDGMNMLLFVARDGYFLKKMYDHIVSRQNIDMHPISVYLEISRSMAIMMSIRSDNDIDLILKSQYTGMWKDYLLVRFGIVINDDDIHGMEIINTGTGFSQIEEYIAPYRSAIIANSKEQRNLFDNYIKKLGSMREGLSALVEPSYRGTIQYYLSKQLNYPFTGYYCAAFLGSENIYCQSNRMKSCFQHNDDLTAERSGVYKNITLLEDGFLAAPTGSCLRVGENGNIIYANNCKTQNNFNYKESLFNASISYVNDYLDLLSGVTYADIPLCSRFIDHYFGMLFDNCDIARDVRDTFYADHNFSSTFDRKIWE